MRGGINFLGVGYFHTFTYTEYFFNVSMKIKFLGHKGVLSRTLKHPSKSATVVCVCVFTYYTEHFFRKVRTEAPLPGYSLIL